MCSKGDDEEDANLLMTKEEINFHQKDTFCRQCKTTKSAVLLQGKFPYCRSCFISYVSHKFSSTIGKSKLMKTSDQVLVAFSASQSSIALIHFLKESLLRSREKKILSKVFVVFIDEGDVLHLSNHERYRIISEIKLYIAECQFDVYFTNLDSTFVLLQYEQIDEDSFCNNSYIPFIDSLDNSSKEDFLFNLRRETLLKCAKRLNCSKIFTAETCDHLASKVLSNISLGRGDQIQSEIGIADFRLDNDITLMRPLRECSKKEICFYNIFNNSPTILIHKLGTSEKNLFSVQKLTEDFIVTLQTNFPSTISTIMGTGNKLSSNADTGSSKKCLFCNNCFENKSTELSAELATELSHAISVLGFQNFDVNTFSNKACNNASSQNECFCSGSRKIKFEDLDNILCYGCKLMFQTADLSKLPTALVEKINVEKKLQSMRDDIQDFLIE